MPSYEFNDETKKARVFFRYAGRQCNKTLKLETERAAQRLCALIEETILDLERGKLAMPGEADPVAFIISGGKVSGNPIVARPSQPASASTTLNQIFNTYVTTLTPGSKESNSLSTEAVHRRHFARVFGGDLGFETLGITEVQKYVDARVKDGVGRQTIRKELSTLRVIWGWAHKRGHVPAAPAWKMNDLTFPKSRERPPFQTWAQIVKKIERGGLTEEKQAELWECLWLNQEETLECLSWVKDHASHTFIYPMFAFAAFTGARRSEMIRSEREDWDFEAGFVSVREKKADRSKTFTRRNVAIHPTLAITMKEWFLATPGVAWTICMPDGRPVIPQTASECLRMTLRGGKWSILHGWHTFRHSLASIMASEGVDQRIINAMLGHSTEEMVRRYRHLLPARQEHALHALFKPKA